MAKKRKKRRTSIPTDVATSVLTKCRRRCCFCYAFNTEEAKYEVQGQIAHINHKNDDNREANLAFLCLSHHDSYDATPSQSKGLTPQELRHYKNRLEEVEARRGRSADESAIIGVKTDFQKLTRDHGQAILNSLTQMALTNRPVVLQNCSGADKIIVTVKSDDLASLIEADDKGLLQQLDIHSVTPLVFESQRTFKFYPEFPMLRTFSKKDHIRLFEQSQFREGFSYKQKRWQAATCINPKTDSLATICIATSSGEDTEIGETMIVHRNEVPDWHPDKPIQFLKTFLEAHGKTLTRRGKPDAKLLLDTKIPWIRHVSGSAAAEISNVVQIANVESAIVIHHSEIDGPNELRLLHMFALGEETILRMKQLVKIESWF